MLKISKIFKCVFLYLLEHSYPRYFHVFGKFNIWVILGLEYVVSSLEKWSYFLDFFFFPISNDLDCIPDIVVIFRRLWVLYRPLENTGSP